jgi:hypothetical protein
MVNDMLILAAHAVKVNVGELYFTSAGIEYQ